VALSFALIYRTPKQQGLSMRRTILGLALLLAMFAGLPSQATEFETAGEMVDVYQRDGGPLPLRLYLRGLGDGISMYNTLMAEGHRAVYCPPGNVGIVDAQYAAIMSGFLQKFPKVRSQPP